MKSKAGAGSILVVAVLVATCARSAESSAPLPLATLPGGVQPAEAYDLETLSLLACAGDGVVATAYVSPEGVQATGFRDEKQVWHKELALDTSAGAVWSGKGRVVLALVDFRGRGLVVLDRQNGSWDETRLPSPVAGETPVWPAFFLGSDGILHVVCFVQTREGLNGRAGLYSRPIGSSGSTWALLRKGIRAWAGAPAGGSSDAFVYVNGERHWAVGRLGSPEKEDTVCPEKSFMVLEGVTSVEGSDYVLWRPASGKMSLRLVLTRIKAGKLESFEVPGISAPAPRFVVGPGGEIGVVGLSEDGVVYVRTDPADPTHLTARVVCRRDQMMADSGAAGLAGFNAVWCGKALHLLYYAVYRDHIDCLHKVVKGF